MSGMGTVRDMPESDWTNTPQNHIGNRYTGRNTCAAVVMSRPSTSGLLQGKSGDTVATVWRQAERRGSSYMELTVRQYNAAL